MDMDDLLRDPKKYGLPTFDEYCKNPDAYRNSVERLMKEVEQGLSGFQGGLGDRTYFVSHYKCNSITKAMEIMRELGWDPKRLDMKIDPDKGTAGRVNFKVTFYQKELVAVGEENEVPGVQDEGNSPSG